MRFGPYFTLPLTLLVASALMPACTRPEVAQSDSSCRTGTLIFSPAIAGRAEGDAIFAVSDAVATPGGGAIISYDPDTPGPGDENAVGAKRLVQVDDIGTVSDVRLPVLDGVQVTVNTVPLVADPNGFIYFYDRDASRVLLRDGDSSWRVLTHLDQSLVFKSPHPSLGPDGALYLATASQILIVRQDELSVIAGATAELASDITFPQPLPLGLPSPAANVFLPAPNALIVGDDNTVYFATPDLLFSISPAGILDYVGALGGKVRLPAGSGPSNFTGMAIGVEGQLIVSDSGNEQLLSLQGIQPQIIAEGVRFIADGAVLTSPQALPLLTVSEDQELVCAL